MTDLVGQTLGRYQLTERLGRGGMADVYKGFQPGLDRYVAVKVLHPHLADQADFINRFQREAKAVASLRHPHIVQVFDFDVQDQNYFMVMEYIEGGKTLKELLQELNEQTQHLTLEQVVDIIAKLADALEYAHQQGMVHRDIKPSNVLVPSVSNPVLGDFGIARLVGQSGLTSSGAMIGTPAYMSPEQGRGETADERSDIYALGIVFYELMAGRPPYDADTPYGVILKHINDPLVLPTDAVGILPQAVERVLLRSLAKDPADRYASSGEMRDALHEALEELRNQTPTGQEKPALGATAAQRGRADKGTLVAVPGGGQQATTVGRPAETADLAAPVERRTRSWVWAVGAVAALAVIGGGVLAWQSGLIPGLAQATEEPVAVVEPTLTEVPPTPTEEPTPEAEPEEEAEELPPAGSNIDDRARAAELVAHGLTLLYDDPEAAFEPFDEAATLDPSSARALAGRAITRVHRGEGNAANVELQEALSLAPTDPLVHFGLGMLYTHVEALYDPDTARIAFTRSVDTCGGDARLCTEALHERALLSAWHLNDFDQALLDIGRAIEVHPNKDEVPYLMGERASMLLAQLDHEGAVKGYQEAYNVSGEPSFMEQAAQIVVQRGEYEEAVEMYDRLLEDKGEDAHLLVGRGYIAWRMRELTLAQQLVNRALRVDPDLLEGKYLLALVQAGVGAPATAVETLRPVATEPETWKYDFPFFNPEFGHEVFLDMATAARSAGNSTAALEFLDRAQERYDVWPHPYIMRGEILAGMNRLDEAKAVFEQAMERAEDYPELQPMIRQWILGLTPPG